MEPSHYVGLDVSQEVTSICVVDQQGAVVWRGKCATDPDSLATALRQHALHLVRAGLETGLLSNFLTRALRARGVPVICLDARHAKAALSMQINKTDANDAHGLAQVVRTGWFREIAVKSMDAQSLRLLLVARAQPVSQRQAIANTLRGLLKAFGHVVRKGAGGLFARRVREVCDGNPALCAIIEPMLTVWQSLREQIRILDGQLLQRAKADATAQRLMSIPAVGMIVALAYVAVIDDPKRFKHSSTVGAYLGLTPRRYQSGDVDCSGHISKCGDGLMRAYLFQAANAILTRKVTDSALRRWGRALVARIGLRRATVAVARKLAVIMHAIWKHDRDFACDGLAARHLSR
jgi:transposase